VDLCLKIHAAGYRLVWTPFAELFHLESASRGSDLRPERLPAFIREQEYMKERWGHILFADPFYNPNLSLSASDFALADPPRVAKPWEKS
jgi:O-antigen biosynthesis protein